MIRVLSGRFRLISIFSKRIFMERWILSSVSWMFWNIVGFCWKRSCVVERTVRELLGGFGGWDLGVGGVSMVFSRVGIVVNFGFRGCLVFRGS